MKKALCLLIALSAVLFLAPSSATTAPGPLPIPFVTDLIAGQHYDVGDVTVWNDNEFLYVNYAVQYVWLRLVWTHLHVATTLDGIPQNKNGIPVPGKFEYKVQHPRWIQDYTVKIPLDDSWLPGTEVCIAAHSVISGVCSIFATGWGNGLEFPGPTWGMYFMYTVQ